MIKNRSTGPLFTRALSAPVFLLASLNRDEDNIVCAGEQKPREVRPLFRNRSCSVFLPVPTVLRSPVIIMLNDSAEARVNVPMPRINGRFFFDVEHDYYMI